MNDGDVQPIVLMKPEHRAFEDGVKTAQRLPAPKSAVGARVVDLRAALAILLDRQLFPLAAQIEQAQNVVEDCVKTEVRRGAATTPAQMRQDKLLELFDTQIRWYPLPLLAFRHLDRQSNRILAGSLVSTETLA